MGRKVALGEKELKRVKELVLVEAGELTLKAASERLGVSYRQGKRILAKYRAGGAAALVHGNSRKASSRKIEASVGEVALSTYRERYSDFGPTFAAEKLLEEQDLEVSAETMRQWLLGAGLWQRHRKRSEHRQRRERRPCFGDLVQFDGSHHKRFEERGGKCCLMNMVDDATGRTYSQFFEQETIEAAMKTLWRWIEQFGIPKALYCDKKNAFVLTREPTDAELLQGITKPKSHCGLACEKLGIEVIAADSPQAKGRVERNHQVYQDRLVKEMRLVAISTMEAANKFLEETYLPKINAKFAKPPREKADGHATLLGANLRNIFCFEYTRTVTNDFVVRHDCRFFQILKENQLKPRPTDKVMVRIHLDGSLDIYWKDKSLLVKEIDIIDLKVHVPKVA